MGIIEGEVLPPPVKLTITLQLPVRADLFADNVNLEVPPKVKVEDEKLERTLEGKPEILKEALNVAPPSEVNPMSFQTEAPPRVRLMVSELGEGVIGAVKLVVTALRPCTAMISYRSQYQEYLRNR